MRDGITLTEHFLLWEPGLSISAAIKPSEFPCHIDAISSRHVDRKLE